MNLVQCNCRCCQEWQRRALEQPAQEGWLPIESAPRDGTRVLLAWDGKSCVGYYLDNSKAGRPWAGWKVPSMEIWPPGQPTAWQPLPAAPTKERA